jgi:heme-degrading monooxygenase HmoA
MSAGGWPAVHQTQPDTTRRHWRRLNRASKHSAAAYGTSEVIRVEIVLFHIKTRDDIDQEEYEKTFQRMLQLVSDVPGFLGLDGFAAEDGSELAVARFESADAIAQWREQPDHVYTQERGREEFFAKYEIKIATVWKEYGWSADG